MLSIRWLYSTNAKDIGTFYLVFAIFAALVGLSFSLIIRLELTTPGVGILNQDAQLYNAVVTAHALAMIFFFVIPASVGGFGDYIIAVLLAIIIYYVTICGEVYKTLLTK